MVPFVTNRGGPLVGIEALSLQGIPVDDLLFTRESEGQMSDLAGRGQTRLEPQTSFFSSFTLRRLSLLVPEPAEVIQLHNLKLPELS